MIEFWDLGKSYEHVAKIVMTLITGVFSHDAGGAAKLLDHFQS